MTSTGQMPRSMPGVPGAPWKSLLEAVRADNANTPWIRVHSVLISRADYDRAISEFPPREGPPAHYSVRLIIDPLGVSGRVVPLDVNGNYVVLTEKKGTER